MGKRWTYQDGQLVTNDATVIVNKEGLVFDEAVARNIATREILNQNRRKRTITVKTLPTMIGRIQLGNHARINGTSWWITSIDIIDDGESTYIELRGERYE